MGEPYYRDDSVELWLGDCRVILPTLGIAPDLVLADPPYGETSLDWDSWPAGWPGVVAQHARSMWCFGSFRMFLDRAHEFAGWRLSCGRSTTGQGSTLTDSAEFTSTLSTGIAATGATSTTTPRQRQTPPLARSVASVAPPTRGT
jgi:hypothetical protein